MKKILLTLALAATATLCASARGDNLYDSDVYGQEVTLGEKHNTFLVDLGVGSSFDVNFRWNHQFGKFKYVTWDILSLGYERDYTKDCTKYQGWDRQYVDGDYYYTGLTDDGSHIVKLTTGIRCFSPKFAGMRAFMALNVGYGAEWRKEGPLVEDDDYRKLTADEIYGDDPDDYYEQADAAHHVAVDFTIGVQFSKFYVGYGLNALGKRPSSTNHVVRLGVTF